MKSKKGRERKETRIRIREREAEERPEEDPWSSTVGPVPSRTSHGLCYCTRAPLLITSCGPSVINECRQCLQTVSSLPISTTYHSSSLVTPVDEVKTSVINHFSYHVPKFIQKVARLQRDGNNLDTSKRETSELIRATTVQDNYRLASLEDPVDQTTDVLVLSIILWSIDRELQTVVKPSSSAYEAFHTLVTKLPVPKRDSHLVI
ncbi:hypothetical protein CROQUDRAFT_94400 [Cronartium quercuum f. sp. fusiforme G11]|uniref:Uncharacterized protein n=1 Tax=Cronartium quercuum f. sp. fusiforme G11 TaxID=708437 RepID=A0A9P6NJY8_9BASI|nr:hypothetical protein CROQUDRAFT_94400 [Cronartium quercuum f. sp. fusiforme G11]